MTALLRLGSIETVIGFLWEITFTVFVVRLALIYAALALVSTVLVACLAHAVVLLYLANQQRHTSPQTLFDRVLNSADLSIAKMALPTLVSTAIIVIVVVGICNHIVMSYARIPQLRRFRLAIGSMAAVDVGLAWLALSFFSPASPECGGHAQKNVDKTPTPTGPLVCMPTAGVRMSTTAFCQLSRVSISCAGSNLSSVSICTIVAIVFVAAVALMPWVSMALLERPSRHYSHRRSASIAGWTTPTKTTTPTPLATLPSEQKTGNRSEGDHRPAFKDAQFKEDGHRITKELEERK
ncbi:hypothetical protein SEPCBS57363_003056 [Sporothrix epigloea]|uniref:Integral membrane protein n=1 Tax=Sporothrix epigloea TaxID=1892477 RepID=A0ABP0DKL8_9PEZI